MKVVTQRLTREQGVLVTVETTQGSAPRDAGAWMMVFSADVAGTIGGGHLEFQAIDEARRHLAGTAVEPVHQYSLGPSLGQCCGGIVRLRFERVGAADVPALAARLTPRLSPLALFGGGHVGKALVMKRFSPRGRGRAARIMKPFSHLTIVVREVETAAAAKA